MRSKKQARKFIIHAVPASPGFTRSKAWAVFPPCSTSHSPAAPARGGESVVVVAEVPSVELVMLWHRVAAGFIFEMGGRFCHAALICLELGIPCVVGAKGIIDKLKKGDFILELDGSSGKVIVSPAFSAGEKRPHAARP